MLRPATFALLLGTLAVGSSSSDSPSSGVPADTPGRFPSVAGASLTGEDFKLPSGFKGGLNVVLVAFARDQQVDVDTWTPFLRKVTEGRPDVRAYELLSLARPYRPIRPIVESMMRHAIPKETLRASTITLYTDMAVFRDALRLPYDDRVYVLLVDQQGEVHGRLEGRFDERAGLELVRRLDAARAARGAGR